MNKLTAKDNPSTKKTRDYYIDNIKGIFIFLVVFGHLLDYLEQAGYPFATGVRTFIYFFHMPGFIFMSGYLAKNFSGKRFKGEKLFTYAWLYLLFKDAIELVHFIFGLPYFQSGIHHIEVILIGISFLLAIWLISWGYKNFSTFRLVFMAFVIGFSLINTNIFYIGAAPWYLLALILWHIFIYLTQHMNPKYVMLGAIIMAAVLDYQEEIGKFLSLSRTINFLPFFLLGFYMSKEEFYKIADNKKLKKILPVLFFVFMGLVFLFPKAFRKGFGVFIYGVSSYEKLSGLAYGFGPFICLAWMIIASLLMFAIFLMTSKKKTFLSNIGKNTISVYVLHRLFKDILYYAGLYDILSSNQYIAVFELAILSLLLIIIFGTSFSAQTITNLSTIKAHWFYVDGDIYFDEYK